MKTFRVAGIIAGALFITALGIDATDTLTGARSTLLGQLISTEEPGGCPPGMVSVPAAGSFACVDQYEASAAATCPRSHPASLQETNENINAARCTAVSQADALPWTNVTRAEAAQLCARADKRLPTAAEWYTFAIGTPDESGVCNQQSGGASAAGMFTACRSEYDVYDTVGNVWEWVSDDVFSGVYQGRPLPSSGYVTQVDQGGVATVSSDDPTPQYGADYVWSEPEGVYAMMRGGFYGSREDAGVYAVHAATDPDFVGAAVGFRCVQ
jgi:formylglycine-generating enzyme required for sulfatase activity